MATKTVQESSLISIADAIREHTGSTGSLVFPSGFTSAITDDLTTVDIINRDVSEITHPTVSKIGSYAFAACSTLTSVSLPAVTSIGGYAFAYCSALISVSFSAVPGVDSYAFRDCTALTSVSFPEATYIRSNAFFNCYSLTSVNFPLVTSIGGYAFAYCSALTSVSFPEATHIDHYAFSNCYSLTSVNLPLVTNLGSNAFAYCSALISVSLPEVKFIWSYTFVCCTALKRVVLGASCSRLSAYAFKNCYNLIELYLNYAGIVSLSGTILSVFGSTPVSSYSSVAGRYASIFVPSDWLVSYQTATSWSTIASKIFSIGGSADPLA